MASPKEYGYFIKGQKLAIIEKDTALDNDVNSKDEYRTINRHMYEPYTQDADQELI